MLAIPFYLAKILGTLCRELVAPIPFSHSRTPSRCSSGIGLADSHPMGYADWCATNYEHAIHVDYKCGYAK